MYYLCNFLVILFISLLATDNVNAINTDCVQLTELSGKPFDSSGDEEIMSRIDDAKEKRDNYIFNAKGYCVNNDNSIWVTVYESLTPTDQYPPLPKLIYIDNKDLIVKEFELRSYDSETCLPKLVSDNFMYLECSGSDGYDNRKIRQFFINLSTGVTHLLSSTEQNYSSLEDFKINSPKLEREISNLHQVSTFLFLLNNNILEGKSVENIGSINYELKPNNTINRAEFTKIIVEATKQPPCTTSTLLDVEPSSWYEQYVQTALCSNIVQGYPDGTFKPANTINAAEAAKIVVNAFGLPNEAPQSEVWYREYWNALEEINAIPDSVTSPSQNITRGEMAEIIFKVMTRDSGE